jgi:hypothetical protein
MPGEATSMPTPKRPSKWTPKRRRTGRCTGRRVEAGDTAPAPRARAAAEAAARRRVEERFFVCLSGVSNGTLEIFSEMFVF